MHLSLAKAGIRGGVWGVRLLLSVMGADLIAEDAPAQRVAFRRPQKVVYEVGGTVGQLVQRVTENWLSVAPERNPAILEMFADRDRKPYRDLLPWSGEFAGKYLTASTQVLRLREDNLLRTKLQDFVDRLVALQDEDGYLGPFPREARLTGIAPNSATTWDAWGHYHIMLGLLLWHQESGDAPALRCAEKIGGMLSQKFLGGGKHVADMGSPDQNQAVIHGMALLYEETGRRSDLELAQQIVEEFALPGSGDYLRQALKDVEFFQMPKPRWESLHAVLGLAELYSITGQNEYRQAFEKIWWSIVKLDRHNNGGFSSGEQAVGNPYSGAPIETCCTVAWMAMSVEMLRLTGNSLVADELELSTLNSAIGAHSEDAKWSTYNTPMDGRRLPSTEDISFQIRPGSEQLNCCSVNAAREFGMLSNWGVMVEAAAEPRPEALIVNWYGPSTIRASVAETQVLLQQSTAYPAEGRVVLTVKPVRPVRFALKLRIPSWSSESKVTLNDQASTSAAAGSYHTIDREWSPGDQITLDLDLRLRVWSGERECAGKVSLYRGPLLLTYELPKALQREAPAPWKDFGNLFASNEKGAVFEHSFVGGGVTWFGKYFDDAGRARVSIDGNEAAFVDQYDPVREKPFAWRSGELAVGRHVLRIEVTGEKRDESRGYWSNVTGFGGVGAAEPAASPKLTPLHLETLNPRRVIAESEAAGAMVMVEVKAADGGTMRLRDFGTAGRGRVPYISWLPADQAPATPFSKANPMRTVRIE